MKRAIVLGILVLLCLPALAIAETVQFPTSADTWNVQSDPYWWHIGDNVLGNRTLGLSAINHADVTLNIIYSSLSGTGHVDLDLRINGVTVGSMIVLPSHGTGYVVFPLDFAPMAGGAIEIQYYETNLVDPGAGSIQLGEGTIDFFGSTPTLGTSWGSVKALY